VAEELGIEQRFRDRTDVDRDEPPAMARAGLMNRSRDHLLAGAGLAGDEDRCRRRRNGFDQLKERSHRRALAGHRSQTESLVELLMQVRVLARETTLLERLVEDVHQLVELKRLRDEVRGAELDHVDGVFHGAVARDDDCNDAGVLRECGFDDLTPVNSRQTQVRDDDVEGKTVERLDRGFAVGGLRDLIAFVCKSFCYNTSQRFLVVHEEEVRHGCQSIDAVHWDVNSCMSNPKKACTDTTCGGNPSGTANSQHHEGVRDGGRQPPHYLQLDCGEQGRVLAHRRRQHSDLRRYVVARTRWDQTPHQPHGSVVSVRMQMTDSKELLHKLNNQLGVILAHAELLETKAHDASQKARASQVVNAALQAMAVSRELRETVGEK
jgi:hypothetical protein